MKGTIFHGGGIDDAIALHGGDREEWLDLSTGINPDAWPVPALPEAVWRDLPDTSALERCEAAARSHYGVPETFEIVAAPGEQALIEVLPRLLPGKDALVLEGPHGVYGEHAHCCAKAGRVVRSVDPEGRIGAPASLTILVRPNNPDGWCLDRAALLDLASRTPAGGWVIVDEAFGDANEGDSLAGSMPTNMIVLRSFGKFFGLAGLRLGFAILPAELAVTLRQALGPWAVSGPALEIGAHALTDTGWIDAMRRRLVERSSQLVALLSRHGLEIAGRHGLFVLAKLDEAAGLHDHLCRQQILVRDFADRPGLLRFGLPGSEDDWQRLDRALAGFTFNP